MLSARRTGHTMGAEVTGADLSQPMGAATFETILGMFLEHKVLVFRNQRVTAPQFLAWASRFGRPEPTQSVNGWAEAYAASASTS